MRHEAEFLKSAGSKNMSCNILFSPVNFEMLHEYASMAKRPFGPAKPFWFSVSEDTMRYPFFGSSSDNDRTIST